MIEEVEDRGDELPEVEDRGDELPTENPSEPEEDTTSGDDDTPPDLAAEAESQEDDTSEDPQPPSIPKARFDEVNIKRKEAEDRLREMETQLAVLKDRQERAEQRPEEKPEPFDFDGKEQEYMDAVLDGDSALAKRIRAEIRDEERKAYVSEAQQVAQKTGTQTLEELKFERVANALVADYAELNQSSDRFDQGRLNDIVELKDAYIASGMASDQALEKAANMVMRDVPKVGAEPAPAPKKKTNVPKNLETAKKQPPMPDVGESNGTTSEFDISKMTDEELAALPKSKLYELRGDYV